MYDNQLRRIDISIESGTAARVINKEKTLEMFETEIYFVAALLT